MLDISPQQEVGQDEHHYSTLARWLDVGKQLGPAVYSFDLAFSGRYAVALDLPLSTARGRQLLTPGIEALNDPSLGLKAFIWPVVEVRLYREAHAATNMTDASGAAAFPPHWLNSRAGDFGNDPWPLPSLTGEAAQRLSVITFESLFHHHRKHCFVLRQDGRESKSISVPYPTSFHATTEEAFQHHVEWVRASSRPTLAVLYAKSHGRGPDGPALRKALNAQCSASSSCLNLYDLSPPKQAKANAGGGQREPVLTNAAVHAELRDATFCLEPQGDTPTRPQLFECLLCGGIPVFFSSCARPDLLYERIYEPFLPRHERTDFGCGQWAVVLDSRRVLAEPGYLMRELEAIASNATVRPTPYGPRPRPAVRLAPSPARCAGHLLRWPPAPA